MLLNFDNPDLGCVAGYIERLSPGQRKSLITLARSQTFPISTDTVLMSKCANILDDLVVEPPYSDYRHQPLTDVGEILHVLITTPYLTGLVIALSLGATMTEQQITAAYHASFDKEYLATQTVQKSSAWDWDTLLTGGHQSGDSIHPLFPEPSPLQRRFAAKLSRFRTKVMSGRIIKPHYTMRGISRETQDWILNRRQSSAHCRHGAPRSFHSSLNPRNVTSRDCVHHYMRTGMWPRGRVEMRQQWKPSILVPRTYFAWGGDAIRTSCYLREFFNLVADQFEPTHRHNRVNPRWLRCFDTPPGQPRFFFYDLTSFTSWFHEQEPFLRALARYFSGTTVFLVTEGVTLTEADLGSLIDQYTDTVNHFPEFYVSSGIAEMTVGVDSLKHQCAGFLGVPGNLVTCTVAHGLAQAEGYTNEHQLQVPGDDVGCEVVSTCRQLDKKACAESLGILQYDKVYFSEQASVYLKRGVRLEIGGVNLAKMLIYPLFPYLQDVTQAWNDVSDSRYKPPPPSEIIPRACRVLVTFYRDLWKITRGELDPSHRSFILDYLVQLHKHMKIPLEGVLQGRYVRDGGDSEDYLANVSIKFPVDGRYLTNDPDLLFADEMVEVFIVREVDLDSVLTDFTDDIYSGSTITVYQKQGWSFLEDMGYVRTVQRTGGESVILIGEEAKEAYLHHMAPRVRTYSVLSDISLSMLSVVRVLPPEEGVAFFGADITDTSRRYLDLEPLTSYKLSGLGYKDPDKPTEVFPENLDYGHEPGDVLWRLREVLYDSEEQSSMLAI